MHEASRSGLPSWCDRFLQPSQGDLFASRCWYDLVLRHALPADAQPVLAATEAVLLPLQRADGWHLRSLATDYSLVWRPLLAPGADAAALREAGRALGRLLRGSPPILLDTVDAEAAGLGALVDGMRDARLVPARFDGFGNWHEVLPVDAGWDAYLAARPPALRNTIARKLPRAEREMILDLVTGPGPALEPGIAAYLQVRAKSWKPWEPFPDFDGALMRALAAAGALRLGVLRSARDRRPIAAQYWAIDRHGGRAMLLKLAHDEAARAASPGTALTAIMIRHLLGQDGVRELDFGRGDDPYKRLWTGRRRQRIGFVLADPLHPAGLAALARQAAGAAFRRLRGGAKGGAP